MSKQINIGIIGYGMAGEVFHAPIINSLSQLNLLKVVSSRDVVKKAIKDRYPNTEVVLKTEEVLGDPNIDLVVIGTPNVSHLELAKKALMANKHVVVEKPFTITSSDADELIELANKKNRILTIHQNRRWDSDFLTVKKIIEKGLLGNVVEYEAHFDRFRNNIKPNAWREENLPGSGMLYDLGSHLIDQAQCLFGLPIEVFGDVRIQRQDGKIDDYFELILYYEKLKVILKSSMLVREPLPHFIILGDRGSFVKYGMDVQEEHLKKGCIPREYENWGEEPKDIWGTLNTEIEGLHFIGNIESQRGDYRGFYVNLYDAINGDAELIVRAEEARNTIRIIELAMESSKEGRKIPYSASR